jgi:uncharacterized damage-inducible protein DinB
MTAFNRALALGTFLLLAPSPLIAQGMPEGFREEFLRQFDSSMSKFEALAGAMPEAAYSWSPGEGVMPVAQVYAHVARYNFLYPSQSLTVPVPAGVDLATMETIKEKSDIQSLLARSRAHVDAAVRQGTDVDWSTSTQLYGRDVQRWTVLLQLLTHMNEHLGQSIAYARMNSVVPPWSR